MLTTEAVVLDTSVFIAILLDEEDAEALVDRLRSHRRRFMSAGTYLECAIVSTRRQDGRMVLDAWLAREKIEVHPVDARLAQLAADAFVTFGKGRHLAALNFGDCFAYALAKAIDAPLLFKGDDFARTDLVPA